ncbi:unnamed protein product [Amaranthus hypochondriacus]
MQSGKPSSSALSLALIPTIPLVSSVCVNPALAFNSSIPITAAGHDSLLHSSNAVNPPMSLNHASPMNVANAVPLSSPSCTPHVHRIAKITKLDVQPEVKSEGILSGVPTEGEDGVGKASALIDVATSNIVPNSVIHNPSLTLSNGFNVLNLEHALSEMVDPSNIALGADPIGDDD